MADDFDPYYACLGIPPTEQPPHHYRLLGIGLFEPNPDVIALAANKRIAHMRTFQTGKAAAISHKIINKITIAKTCLMDPVKKLNYDTALSLALHIPLPPPPKSPGPPPPLATPPVIKTMPAVSLGSPRIVKNISQQPGQPSEFAKFCMSALSFYRQHGKHIRATARKVAVGVILIALLITLYKNHETVWNFVVEKTSALVAQFSGSTREPSQQRSALQRVVVIDKATKQTRGASAPIAPSNGSSKPGGSTAGPDSGAAQGDPDNAQNAIAAATPDSGSDQPVEITTLNLPSGKVFKVRIFKVNINSVVELLKDPAREESIIFLEDPLGRIGTFAEFKQGVLDGMSVAYNESRLPTAYATYSNGELDGMIKTWNDGGNPVYCCQYSKGVRNGFCCYFKGNCLRLLLEIDRDDVKAVHLCSCGKLEKSFSSLEQAAADKVAQKLLAEVDNLESDLKMNEQAFNKAAHDEILRVRKERKAATTPQKKALLQDRLNKYATEKQALTANFWRYKGW